MLTNERKEELLKVLQERFEYLEWSFTGDTIQNSIKVYNNDLTFILEKNGYSVNIDVMNKYGYKDHLQNFMTCDESEISAFYKNLYEKVTEI